MNTVKNCHSPAGMGYYARTSYAYAIDCPACKYGTLEWERTTDKKGNVTTSDTIRNCIDCHVKFVKDGKEWRRV